MTGIPTDPPGRHRAIAARFTQAARATADWDAPTPVPEWLARDVVGHLVGWFPPFLASGSDVTLAHGPAVADDPLAAWQAHADAVQALLDDPATAARSFSNPHTGDLPLDQAVDRFYTTDVFLHTWDLARAAGEGDVLDPTLSAQLYAGMQPMDELLRSSGQYGPRVPVAADARPQDQLVAFIGRDPEWRP